jgi:hypothetical protein
MKKECGDEEEMKVKTYFEGWAEQGNQIRVFNDILKPLPKVECSCFLDELHYCNRYSSS